MSEGLATYEVYPTFHVPLLFNELLERANLSDDVYRAMSSPDASDVVMIVLDAMKLAKSMPQKVNVQKTAKKSTTHRQKGNEAYGNSQYQDALIHYNMALLLAPNNSRELKLAYSNRSALLLKLKAFSKCIKDIDMILKLGEPEDIRDKLRKRYVEAAGFLWMENLRHDLTHPFSRSYFEFDVKRNPLIPSASTDVGVIVENKVPKIIATTNVKAGVVLAIEPSFVSITSIYNYKICCYYCQKFDFNLMPCNSCCIALFCSEECRRICLKEYHGIECQVLDTLEQLVKTTVPTPRIAVKAVLKMMFLSKNWQEFVAETQLLGLERVKKSSINEIYDVKHKYSLLNSIDTRHFLHGPLYNASLICAATIYIFESTTLFPQKAIDSEAVKRAFARAYLHMYLHCGLTEMIQPITSEMLQSTEYYNFTSYAWFSMLGKFHHSCQPNCTMFNLNKHMALVATQPIKCGEELTVSHVDNWHHKEPLPVRQLRLYGSQGNICRCTYCINQKSPKLTALNDMQKSKFDKLAFNELLYCFTSANAPEVFKKTCKALTFLNTAQTSREYIDTCALFRKCMLSFQDYVCKNEALGND